MKGFARFSYDFIVGDDWKIAAGVVTTLALGAIVAATVSSGSTWLPPLVAAAIVLVFTIALLVDVRRRRA
jgi:hypothetical protein